MPEKGKTNNPNGRPKGSKNAKSIQWEALGDSIVSTHAERFNKFLASAEDEDFAKYFTQVLEHFKPKLSRTENKSDIKEEVTINFVRKNGD